jgi:hypothetical protein
MKIINISLYLFIFIFIFISIYSCMSVKYKYIGPELESEETYELSPALEEYYLSPPEHIQALPPLPPSPPTSNVSSELEINEGSSRIETKYNVDNKIDTIKLEYSGHGIITYQVPDNINFNETYIFKLRITSNKDINLNELILGNRSIPLSEDLENGKITIENIAISEYMSAYLWADPNGFDIYNLSTITQKINDKTYTEWSWKLTPIGYNKEYYIKMYLNLDDSDFIVYQRKMKINISFKDKVSILVNKNYQWLWTAIIVPFIIPFIIRKVKKRKDLD